MTRAIYIERALFVVAQPGGGKSVHLRNMFRDCRFGKEGIPPEPRRCRRPKVKLSNERTLIMFIQSPQENDDNKQAWIDNIKGSICPGRWCFAGALQSSVPSGRFPNALDYIKEFIKEFSPERVRICFISPDCHRDAEGNPDPRPIGEYVTPEQVISAISSTAGVESVTVDGRLIDTNAMMMADFFDFT